MGDIIVRPKSDKETKALLDFFKSKKISFNIITQEMEDVALLEAMKQADDATTRPIEELYKEMGWE
jgi:hypothetical protein